MTTKELINEVHIIQKRVKRREAKNILVTTNMILEWIQERHPNLNADDKMQIYNKVRF